ncbi:hypothetical protein SAMN05443144_14710 [Fodinibius roseus]|uniref:Uncharacterized protein n=1 Tax=Fodinibius roseus TaxID=1194090 RepID=A0A1M5M0L6_9BACT|nr:hypothetical protein [Fodinibius roseus]SHG70223.1 hypothetical protein SAMN05443144_14710 [Fodinibius roseus]
MNRQAWHQQPLTVLPKNHTMGNSLYQYLSLKIPHPLINFFSDIEQVIVRGNYKISATSSLEKPNKIFNVERPVVNISNSIAYVNCFPGFDYILHFSSVISSYFALLGVPINIKPEYPTRKKCETELRNSLNSSIPNASTIVLGKVDFLSGLSSSTLWKGHEPFLWKPVDGFNNNAILLGCKHTIWGEIAGRLVSYLCKRGANTVLYIGKLGSLDYQDFPNRLLATSSKSILPNGQIIEWQNLFTSANNLVIKAPHITVPSVMQETNDWFKLASLKARFVDPEIGWMALAANNHSAKFSHLHIISDNLSSRNFPFNLSNERVPKALALRKKLYHEISLQIKKVIKKVAT